MEKEATIDEKIRISKKEKPKKRGKVDIRREPGQPKKKRMRLGEGVEEKI